MPQIGTPEQVQLGPGALYVAAVATAEPTSASAALPSASWFEVGFTEDGSRLSYEISNEGIFVEERFDPIFYRTTERAAKIMFEMAESTRRNLALAMNAGAGQANTAAGIGPPAPGTEARVKIAWVNDVYVNDGGDDDKSMIVGRQCLQAGTLEINRQKSPDKTLMAVEFNLELPSTTVSPAPPGSDGNEPFWVFPTSDGLV